MSTDSVIIAIYARTPIDGFQGVLTSLKATELGAAAVKAAVERASAPHVIDRRRHRRSCAGAIQIHIRPRARN